MPAVPLAITGSTGQLGGRVARRLADAGVPQRLLVRDPARAPQLPGATAVRASYGDADAVRAALEGTLPLTERLRQREADYRQDAVRAATPRISWHDSEVSGVATSIVEVRATDRAGLLYRLTAALAAEGLDVTSARIETLGADAADYFYVSNPAGCPIDAEQRSRVETALVAATRGAVPAPVHSGGGLPREDTPG